MDVNLLDLGGSIPFEVRGHAESSEAASANKTAGEDLPGHPKYAELICSPARLNYWESDAPSRIGP